MFGYVILGSALAMLLASALRMALTNVASGATKRTALLNALNQEATLWVAGQAKVGINLFGLSGTGTWSFLYSTDGIQFYPLTVGVYPATAPAVQTPAGSGNLPGSGVTSATAAGNWEVNVGNAVFVRVQQTAGTGSIKVIMAASVDGSYQEAFLSPANIGVTSSVVFPSTTSTAADTNTCTIPAVANATINLTYCEVSMAGGGAGANAQLRIWDGAVGSGVPLYSCFLTAPVGSVGTSQKINIPVDAQGNLGLQGTPGNAMTIQIRNLGTTSTVINTRVSYL